MNSITSGKANLKYISIVLFLAVLSGGIIFWQYSELQKEKISPAEVKTSGAGEGVEADEAANWRVYKNTAYGFEMKYPGIFTTEEEDFSLESSIGTSTTGTGILCYDLFAAEDEPRRLLNELKFISPEENNSVVNVRIYNNANNLSLDDWIAFGSSFLLSYPRCANMDYAEIDIENKKEIYVDGFKGLQGNNGCCGACNKQVYLNRNGKVYNLSLEGYAGEGCDPCCPFIEEGMFDQMLSDFKFI